MQFELQEKLRNNPLLLEYLRENSYWYKYLNRGEEYFYLFEREAKSHYKIRFQDKVDQACSTIQMVKTMMDVLK